jgi:hypothetical protein
METMMAGGLILSPLGLIIFVVIPLIAIRLLHRPELSAARLAAGYIGALVALALGVGRWSYFSFEDAVSVWHITPERYWSELLGQYVSIFVVTAFLSVVGMSVVGIPVLIALSNCSRATVPWFVLASVLISTLMAILESLLVGTLFSVEFLRTWGLLVISHVILTMGFSLAARLPWTFGRNAERSFK